MALVQVHFSTNAILLNPLVVHCTLTCMDFNNYSIFSHIGCRPDHSALHIRTPTVHHGLINYKLDTKAKYRHIKKSNLYFDTGRGGGLTRERLEGQQFTMLGRKYQHN
jgi:hypothetical protein